MTRLVVGASEDGEGSIAVLRDWELLKELNAIGRSDTSVDAQGNIALAVGLKEKFITEIEQQTSSIAEMMLRPRGRAEIILLPES